MSTVPWPRISFISARDEAVSAIDYCLPNLLAGTVGVVAAPAGIGKTALLMQMGAAVAAGVSIAGGLLPAPEKTGRVVFLATEDPHSILIRRAHYLVRSLAAQGFGSEVIERLEHNFHFYSLYGLQSPIILSDDSLSAHSLDKIEVLARDARLLVLDPIRSFHLCNEQDFGRMSMLFSLLSSVAANTGCTILFSHHVAQPSVDGLGEPEGAQGSSAFVDATRWVVNMNGMSLPEAEAFCVSADRRRDYVRVSFTKSNYGPPLAACWLRRSEQFEGILERCEPELKNPAIAALPS